MSHSDSAAALLDSLNLDLESTLEGVPLPSVETAAPHLPAQEVKDFDIPNDESVMAFLSEISAEPVVPKNVAEPRADTESEASQSNWWTNLRQTAKKVVSDADGLVKNARLEKLAAELRTTTSSALALGTSTFSDILMAVAPPISSHEVLSVQLSHDAYFKDSTGIVFAAMSAALEMVEGGEVSVPEVDQSAIRNQEWLSVAAPDWESAQKLADASLDSLLKGPEHEAEKQESAILNPTTTTPIYLRLQPYLRTIGDLEYLSILLVLKDTVNNVSCSNISATIPTHIFSLAKPSDDWLCDMISETIGNTVSIIGREYVLNRMGKMREEQNEKEKK